MSRIETVHRTQGCWIKVCQMNGGHHTSIFPRLTLRKVTNRPTVPRLETKEFLPSQKPHRPNAGGVGVGVGRYL